MNFSITFMDGSIITGKVIKMVHNGIDVTNYSRDEIMKCFINRYGEMQITTQNYNVEFLINNVSGFSL